MGDSDFESPPSKTNRRQATPEGVVQWKRLPMSTVNHTISTYCRDKQISTIRDVLQSCCEDTFGKFKSSCFGKFLKLPTHVWKSNQAIHYVISREIIVDEAESDALWFRINDSNLRFSKYEFALITGLKFGVSSLDPCDVGHIGKDSLYNRAFKKRKTPVYILWDKFCNRKLGPNNDDYVKAAKICFVYFVLLGLDCKNPKLTIADWIWGLIEKHDDWESFPWGRFSFQFLLHFIRKIRTSLTGHDRENYHLFGFTTAFQAWIYCAIPQLGVSCGGISSTSRIPRILRFLYNKSILDIENVTSEVFPTLEPSALELKKAYWNSTIDDGRPLLLHYTDNQVANPNKRERQKEDLRDGDLHAKKRASARHDDVGNVPLGNKHEQVYTFSWKKRSRLVQEIGDYTVDQVMLRLENVDTQHKLVSHIGNFVATSILSRIKDFIPLPNSCSAVANIVLNDSDERVAALAKEKVVGLAQEGEMLNAAKDKIPHPKSPAAHEQHILREANQGKQDIPLDKEVGLENIDDHFYAGEDNAVVSGSNEHANMNETPSTLGKGWTQNSTWGFDWTANPLPIFATLLGKVLADDNEDDGVGSHKDIVVKPDFKDVRRRARSHALLSPYRDDDHRGGCYYRNYLKKSKNTTRNVGIGYGVDKGFFTDIEKHTFKLENIHIDSYLSILHSNPSFASVRDVNGEIAISSTSLMSTIQQVWRKYHPDGELLKLNRYSEEFILDHDLAMLSKFVTGELPSWGERTPWYNYNKVVTVCHLPDHWIACLIDLRGCFITIYDSYQKFWTPEIKRLRRFFFTPLLRILPQVLRFSGFWDCRGELKAKFTQWTFTFPEDDNLFVQEDSTSCGLFALKFVEAILTGNITRALKKKDLDAYRNHLAKTLFAWSTDSTTLPVQ